MAIRKLISCGQSDADRAARDAAIMLGIPVGGLASRGRPTGTGRLQDNVISEEMSIAHHLKRMEQCIIDSSATVIFSYGKLAGGSVRTQKLAARHNKPCIHFDLNETQSLATESVLSAWSVHHEIKILHIAGSSAGQAPDMYDTVFHIIESVLSISSRQTAPAQRLTDCSVEQYMRHIPNIDSSSAEVVEQVINHLSLKERVAIANMEKIDMDGTQAAFKKLIIAKTGLEPEANIAGAVWKTLRKSHRLRPAK